MCHRENYAFAAIPTLTGTQKKVLVLQWLCAIVASVIDCDLFETTNSSYRLSSFLVVDPFSDTQGIFQFAPQITDFSMAKQKLNSPLKFD